MTTSTSSATWPLTKTARSDILFHQADPYIVREVVILGSAPAPSIAWIDDRSARKVECLRRYMGIDNALDTQLQNWLDLLRTGHADARAQVINYACERVRKLTSRMLARYPHLRRWEQTEDVMQKALMRLHRSLSDISPGSVGQLMGLAALQIRRELVDLIRHHYGPLGQAARHFTAGRGVAADDSDGPVSREAGPHCEPETLEAWQRFHEAAGALPEAEREIFGLLWYADMTPSQAASALDITTRTVRRRWESARCLLYDAMKGQSPE